MIKKTGFVLTGVLYGAIAYSAAGGGVQGLPAFPDPLRFVLQRIVNPKQEMLGGGTHNLIQYGCMSGGVGCQGFLSSGQEYDDIGVEIPVDKTNHALIFSVAKRRFALFHDASGARHLVLREFGRCGVDEYRDLDINVDGLPDPAYGKNPVVVEILHGATFKCRATQAGISKRIQASAPASGLLVHMPPERVSHQHGCCCVDCVSQLPPVPKYPAPSCPPALPFTLSSE